MLFHRTRQDRCNDWFFVGLVSLVFMVEGPIHNLLPGEPLVIAWPLYTVVGSVIVILVGNLSHFVKRI
ncbi:hypothetical protein CK503_07890 [Aliifodinibius salipaludis]|uniref:DUF5668 domain-containing protein n=1 Tax=Fodinibius salipaludis TaxID=2032627 RepID=A0A2A2GBB9_9BACT|nr:hypothetical protein [Aliifodinibius salipaludis]PAU94125.1 hypothetical protein CK503_07890 [Aliifodinibius salipaludis]